MDTKVNFLLGWFGTTITTLAFSIAFLVYLSTDHFVQPSSQNFQLYAALPEAGVTAKDDIGQADAREKIIRNFFKGYESILADYSNVFLQVAEKYKLDYRLLPAISMQESNGGKRVIKGSYNPFGYGIYGSKVLRFNSWEEAIERVGRGLREDYLNIGLTEPNTIMAKYTPPSLAKGGAWAKGVNSFMEELR